MKRIGIHQINYFPWIGYFNKMVKSDIFIYLDEVQLTDRGFSQRTPMVNSNGNGAYLNVSVEKHGHRDKEFREINLNNDVNWRETQINFLKGNYNRHPFFNEIMPVVERVLSEDHKRLVELNLRSIECIKELLEIETPTVMQSSLKYDRDAKKNDLMMALTQSCGGDVYLSGNGARKYMVIKNFELANIRVQFLKFQPFIYPQYKSEEFISGLSVLDLLFNVGVTGARDWFWNNLQDEEVFETSLKSERI